MKQRQNFKGVRFIDVRVSDGFCDGGPDAAKGALDSTETPCVKSTNIYRLAACRWPAQRRWPHITCRLLHAYCHCSSHLCTHVRLTASLSNDENTREHIFNANSYCSDDTVGEQMRIFCNCNRRNNTRYWLDQQQARCSNDVELFTLVLAGKILLLNW